MGRIIDLGEQTWADFFPTDSFQIMIGDVFVHKALRESKDYLFRGQYIVSIHERCLTSYSCITVPKGMFFDKENALKFAQALAPLSRVKPAHFVQET